MAGTLILTRGLPGSGKTTEAMKWLAANPGSVRLNRDALREALYGRAGVLDYAAEQSITVIQQTAAGAALTAGQSVIVDDMNLRAKYARDWADLAVGCGATLEVLDLTGVPLRTCIDRDAARLARGERGVGEDVIRGLHAKFLASGRISPVTPTPAALCAVVEPYAAPRATRPAWIVDMDGTLAIMGAGEGVRSPFDWHRVGEDTVHQPVAELVKALASTGSDGYDNTIIVMSGRDNTCYEATANWLDQHSIPWDRLYMRPAGDTRKDSVVKAELFDKHVRREYDVRGVIDDRDSVVSMWRSMGLMCAQVAPGAF